MKKYFFIILSVICIFLFILCISDSSVELDGTVVDKENEYPAEIILKQKNFDSIFKKMSGGILLKYGNNVEEYDFTGKIYSHHEGINIIDIVGYIEEAEDPDFTFGRMYFDDNMQNIVLILEEKEIYSAGTKFVSKVKEIIRNTK